MAGQTPCFLQSEQSHLAGTTKKESGAVGILVYMTGACKRNVREQSANGTLAWRSQFG